jgi:hypothetical protein
MLVSVLPVKKDVNDVDGVQLEQLDRLAAVWVLKYNQC